MEQVSISVLRKLASRARLNCRLFHQNRRLFASSVGTASSSADSQKPTTEFPTSADVVIIGGGSIGCHTLYQLTKLGVTNCVLLERDLLTSGTTWHTAGLYWSIRPSDVDMELTNVNYQLNTGVLEEETGLNTGFIRNGGLQIATCENRLLEFKRQASLARSMGLDCTMLTPAEVLDLHPILNVEDVVGALYCPNDGVLDAAALMTALTKAATQRGAKVIEHCSVLNIDTLNSGTSGAFSEVPRVTGVHTNQGTISTNAVICCAGAWSPQIGRMVGVTVPIASFKHNYVVTEPIKDLTKPVPNVRDPDYSYYFRTLGTALEIGSFESNPIYIDQDMPNDFSFSLYDFDWGIFEETMMSAIKRAPVLETSGIKSQICGPEAFTPDHAPLFGEAPQCRGFYFGCGMNSQGMMYGAGYGQQLAQWVVHGRPSKHMYKYDIRRFNPNLTVNQQWVMEKSQEYFSKNYSIGHPLDEPLAGRNQVKSPLHQVLLEKGAVYEEKEGWERPKWFATDGQSTPVLPYDYYGAYPHTPLHKDYPYYHQRLTTAYTWDYPGNFDIVKSECMACRNSAAVFDMSSFGKYIITGPDSQKAADWIFSADMRKPPGSVVYSLILNSRGKIEGDLTVSILDPNGVAGHFPKLNPNHNHYYVVVGGSVRNHSWIHIRNQIMDRGWEVDLVDITMDSCMISVQGRKSRDIIQKLCPDYSLDTLIPNHSNHARVAIFGHDCQLLRVSFVGEMGFEVHAPWGAGRQLYNAIMEAGEEFGVKDAGMSALQSLSAEKGYALFSSDIWQSDYPSEAGLAFACKMKTDIPFLGRTAIEESKGRKASKRLAFVRPTKPGYLWAIEPVFRDGKPVGMIRRADYAHFLGSPVGWAMLRCGDGEVANGAWIKSGSFEIERFGERIPAEVSLKSPFDPKNERLAGIYS